MEINLIHDSRRSEKHGVFTSELNRQGVYKFKVWDCIVLPNVVESISESFKMIIKDAKERGLPECLIMEDDVMFPNKEGLKYFLENKPFIYDVYVGGSYLTDNRNEYVMPLVKVKEWVGNHCILINERYYDTWLSTNSLRHCDTEQSGKGEFYLCFPMVALQKSGWSANNQSVVNYNSAIPSEYVYK